MKKLLLVLILIQTSIILYSKEIILYLEPVKYNSNIIKTIENNEIDHLIAKTGFQDTINGITDNWMLVIDNQGVWGWTFRGDLPSIYKNAHIIDNFSNYKLDPHYEGYNYGEVINWKKWSYDLNNRLISVRSSQTKSIGEYDPFFGNKDYIYNDDENTMYAEYLSTGCKSIFSYNETGDVISVKNFDKNDKEFTDYNHNTNIYRDIDFLTNLEDEYTGLEKLHKGYNYISENELILISIINNYIYLLELETKNNEVISKDLKIINSNRIIEKEISYAYNDKYSDINQYRYWEFFFYNNKGQITERRLGSYHNFISWRYSYYNSNLVTLEIFSSERGL